MMPRFPTFAAAVSTITFLPAQTFAETRHTHILFMAGFTADVYGQHHAERKDEAVIISVYQK